MIGKGAVVRIKKGATVGQDFSWFEWDGFEEAPELVFLVRDVYFGGRAAIIAHGYGMPSSPEDPKAYGCGALHVKLSDLIPENEVNYR